MTTQSKPSIDVLTLQPHERLLSVRQLLVFLLQNITNGSALHTVRATVSSTLQQQWLVLNSIFQAKNQYYHQQYALYRLVERFVVFVSWSLAPGRLMKITIRHAIAAIILYWLHTVGKFTLRTLFSYLQQLYIKLRCTLGSQYHIKQRKLLQQMRDAKDYIQWEDAAYHLDELEGKHSWKYRLDDNLFDAQKIQHNVTHMKNLIKQHTDTGDATSLMRYLRSRLVRNVGNIGNERLYSYLRVGTKALIEEYNELVLLGLERVANDATIPQTVKLSFFRETRHSYGRSAVMFSGGAGMGLYHSGVLRALKELQINPLVYSGSSVGSIFCALYGSRTEAELEHLGEMDEAEKCRVSYDYFPSGKGAAMRKLKRLWNTGRLLDMNMLSSNIRKNLGDLTFQEAYDQYGKIINISVTNYDMEHEPLLCNYLTTPNVLVWSATSASCSIPGIYDPVSLMSKNKDGQIVPYHPDDTKYVDGSVKLDLPMERLRELFNVNHFIVSQVNPHVQPFLYGGRADQALDPIAKVVRFLAKEVNTIVYDLLALTKLDQIEFLGIKRMIAMTQFVRTQTYRGDITLVPEFSLTDLQNLLENPTPDAIARCCMLARRYTWEKASWIHAQCEVEMALDTCVRRIRGELIYQATVEQIRYQQELNGEQNGRQHTLPSSHHPQSAEPRQPHTPPTPQQLSHITIRPPPRVQLKSCLSYASHQQMLAIQRQQSGSSVNDDSDSDNNRRSVGSNLGQLTESYQELHGGDADSNDGDFEEASQQYNSSQNLPGLLRRAFSDNTDATGSYTQTPTNYAEQATSTNPTASPNGHYDSRHTGHTRSQDQPSSASMASPAEISHHNQQHHQNGDPSKPADVRRSQSSVDNANYAPNASYNPLTPHHYGTRADVAAERHGTGGAIPPTALQSLAAIEYGNRVRSYNALDFK